MEEGNLNLFSQLVPKYVNRITKWFLNLLFFDEIFSKNIVLTFVWKILKNNNKRRFQLNFV